MMRRAAGLLVLALLPSQPVQAAGPANAVHVVGALHELHATEPAFDFAALGRLLDAIQPEVLVLEVRPTEFAGRSSTPGRPEYPAVLWPWIASHDVPVVAMEPDGKDFARITSAAGKQIATFKATNSDATAYWGRLQDSLEVALRSYWNSVSDTQDQVTADLARSLAVTEVSLVGPAFGTAQAEWDDYMVARARAAVLAHPGKRILVLGSYRNRAQLAAGLKAAAGARLVDTGQWLRETGFDAPARQRSPR